MYVITYAVTSKEINEVATKVFTKQHEL